MEGGRIRQDSRSEKGLKLFGVTILGDGCGGKEAEDVMRKEAAKEVMRKCKSMGNLAACGSAPAAESGAGDNGYLSDGGLVQSSTRRGGRGRKRGMPWTEEEHRTFLSGLKMLGKGDWRGISRNFVTTRTPTQVASHAQKYFLRQTNPTKKKRRSSLFDVVISDPLQAPESETSALPLSSKKSSEVTEKVDHHLQDSYLQVRISGNSKDQVVPALFLAPPLDISNQTFTSCQASLTACVPDFLKVSLSPSIQLRPHYPTQFTAASPPQENSNLELSIAPPQQHSLTKLSSPKAAETISVI
ncbi:transcription factor KUA1 [Cocos nucifera]|uniref:Transcription factor KUA1 n=1 Tax=Cocos nucifera TaxID=13894 RepID=A0A8K0IJU4_COCNU|nr:transcription factor KUA1 [Cocos nucifera]